MRPNRRLILGPIVLATMAATGCATTGAQPPLPEHVRRELGVVAVVISPESSLDPRLTSPVPSRAGAAAVGAGVGLGAGVLAGATCLGSYGFVWPACAIALWTPVMVATGAVEGAVKGVPIAELRASSAAIKDATGSDVATRLGEQLASEAIRRLGEGRGRFDGGGPSYEALKDTSANTVLELRLQRVALERAAAPGSLPNYGPSFSIERVIDAPLTLRIDVQVRVLRAPDGSPVWTGAFSRRGGHQKLTDWGRDDAAEFRQELDRGIEMLRDEIAGAVFGPPPTPTEIPSPRRDDDALGTESECRCP